MSLRKKRIITLIIIVITAIFLGRIAVRALLNLVMGGTMFGGNFL